MADTEYPEHFPREVQVALRRESSLAEGRYDAFRFAWDNEGNLERIRARIEEIEEMLSDPVLMKGPMAMNAMPRLYRQAYLEGLKDIAEIILKATATSGKK